MKNIVIIFIAGLMLNIVNVVQGQETTTEKEIIVPDIKGLDDLKSALTPATLFPILQSMESWMPLLVSSVNWHTEMSRNILLNYHIDHTDDNDSIFKDFLAESEIIIKELDDFFDMEQLSKQERLASATRLNCFIIKVESDFTFGTLPDPHLLFFYLDPNRDPKYMQRFRHEYAHWVFGRIYGEAPSLFYEGVATYAEKISRINSDTTILLAKGIQIKDIPPLEELAFNESFWKCKNNYTISAQFIRFLTSKWGWPHLKRLFLATDYDDPDIHNHFKEVYGLSLQELEPDWRTYLKLNQDQ